MERICANRAPKFYEAGMDLKLSNDPYESYMIFQGRVIKEYQKMVENLKNTFNLTKNVLAKMFTSMAKSSDGLKRSYYEHCAYVASEASMVDSDKLYLGSYEDYVNSGSARGFF